MNPVTLTLTEDQASELYFALASSILSSYKMIESVYNKGERKYAATIKCLEHDRDVIQSIQNLIPESCIKF
jgi:hypothetical protein